jgi:hypothetical protein
MALGWIGLTTAFGFAKRASKFGSHG